MRRPYFYTTLIALLLIAIGWAAYGFSLRLPLFSDDIPHFQWVEKQTWWGVLTSSLWGVGFYRPLTFLVWKLLRSLQGSFHAPTLHGLNLALHLLNAFLVWGLINRRVRKAGWLVGGASALLFLLYPFSYQAVPWVGPLTHLLVTTITLGSLCLYRIADSRTFSLLRILLSWPFWRRWPMRRAFWPRRCFACCCGQVRTGPGSPRSSAAPVSTGWARWWGWPSG